VSRVGEERNANKILVRKPLERSPRGKLRLKLKDNIKMDLRMIGCEDGRWMELPGGGS